MKWQSEDAQLKRDLATIEARTEGAEAERNRIIELVERERIKPDAAMFAPVYWAGYQEAIDDILAAIKEGESNE